MSKNEPNRIIPSSGIVSLPPVTDREALNRLMSNFRSISRGRYGIQFIDFAIDEIADCFDVSKGKAHCDLLRYSLGIDVNPYSALIPDIVRRFTDTHGGSLFEL